MTRRDNFVKRRKHRRSLAKGTGGCNPCFKPSNEANKEDLREFHREDLRLRRHYQLERQPNAAPPVRTKNDNPSYRKSIWPAAKVARKAAQQ